VLHFLLQQADNSFNRGCRTHSCIHHYKGRTSGKPRRSRSRIVCTRRRNLCNQSRTSYHTIHRRTNLCNRCRTTCCTPRRPNIGKQHRSKSRIAYTRRVYLCIDAERLPAPFTDDRRLCLLLLLLLCLLLLIISTRSRTRRRVVAVAITIRIPIDITILMQQNGTLHNITRPKGLSTPFIWTQRRMQNRPTHV
jgi:hypothetical protein